MGKWIDWSGGSMPLAGLTKVMVRLRDGESPTEIREAHFYAWHHDGRGDDIVAYRVVLA